ncbi:uncharacterized protein [Nicotiana tomentosiformis]|uniref:uncharacterized protein n=1 Tax=Nicotiana tomentosiformis TaxID=4098 RepID=UPI00388C82F8
MLIGYKPPKFDIFNGIGDPHAHLRAYYDKLVGVGRNEKLKMKLFIRSLTGEELTWYTRQDPRKWREWQDMAEDFMNHFWFNTEITPDRVQEGIYLEKMLGMMGLKFLKLVKMGDFLEEGIQSGKVQSMAALQVASKAIQSGSIGNRKKKKEQVQRMVEKGCDACLAFVRDVSAD